MMGAVIVLCTIGFGAGSLLKILGPFVFWTKTIAVITFGLSWIIKGRAIKGSINRLRALRRRA